MKFMYKLRDDQVLDQNGEAHTVYGIELWEDGVCVRAVSDVFFARERAAEFVSLCNRLQLSAIHLEDVIEDVLESGEDI